MNGLHKNRLCPKCGEPVQQNWKICPCCETPLITPLCPRCKAPVKEHWKRCPECEAPLVCRFCGNRLPKDQTECPVCKPEVVLETPASESFTEPTTGMQFLYIPGGSFMMGDTFGEGLENELPVHRVLLDGFYMATCPVTQAQWKSLMEENPSKFHGEDQPVEQVTWHDARDFNRKLTIGSGGNYRFELPTEAQWEYAARSGGKEELYAGGDRVDDVAWYEENSGGISQPVGRKAPNGLGLHDMSGNVWEWCLDAYLPNAYKRHETTNPVCRNGDLDKVLRGGSWNLDAWSARCARRFSLRADLSGAGVGFRPVMLT